MRHVLLSFVLAALCAAVPAASQEPPQFLLEWSTGGSTSLDRLFGIASDASGRVYVADTFNDRVVRYTADGVFQLEWGQNGSDAGEFVSPRGITVSNGQVLVTDLGNHRVQVFSTDGVYLSEFGSFGFGDGQFRNPAGVAVDSTGNIYVTERANHRVQKFTAAGAFVTRWGRSGGNGTPGSAAGEFNEPFGVAIDTSGCVVVADQKNHRIQRFTSDGVFVDSWGGMGDAPGEFNEVSEVAVGPDGAIYAADRGNHRIQVFAPDGSYRTQWGCFGPGANNFNFPTDVAVDGSCVYVADTFNDRVQKFGDPVTYAIPVGANLTTVLDFSTVQFDNVTAPGQLSERLQCAPLALPGGILSVPAEGGLFLGYAGSVDFTGEVEVCIPYNPADVTGVEANLLLLQFDPSAEPHAWRVVRTTVDVNANVICGVSDSLGVYALAEQGGNQTGVDPPTRAEALRAFPNPFSQTTRIAFHLETPGPAAVRVFDVAGREVREVAASRLWSAGNHQVEWNGRTAQGIRAAPGVYFVHLAVGERRVARRVVLLP